MICPKCGGTLDRKYEGYYCPYCYSNFSDEEIENEQFGDYNESYSDFGEPDYDSMINNGDEICLNCTYWSVSPYGASHGMVCRRNYPTNGPGDSCSDFVQSHHFGSYGDNGQYQFNETRRNIKNKLNYWEDNR